MNTTNIIYIIKKLFLGQNLDSTEEHIHTLIELGLTPNQAKLYLCLLRVDKACGGMLSKQTKLARQEVYRLLGDLVDKGLVEKVISSPLQFRAIPIQDGISSLMIQKAMEFKQVKARTLDLIKEYSSTNPKAICEREYNFLLISGKTVVHEKRIKMIERSKECIKLITTSKRFGQGFDSFKESYRKALKKNVSLKIIVEHPEHLELITKTIKKLNQYPTFEVRFIPSSKANILITDHEEAIVTLYPNMDIGVSPLLWTNHPGFLDIYHDYFDTLWSLSKTSYQENPQSIL